MKKVLAGGCFNKVHKGHIYFLKQAKKLGDFLIVVISNDKLNRKKYRKNALPARVRKKNIETLGIADKIVIGDKKDFTKVIKKEKPEIIALGYDQKLPVKTKVKMRRIRKFGNYSSRFI